MAIIRWDPFRNITTLQDRINRLFEDAFPREQGMEEDLMCVWRPQVDIYEDESGFVLLVDLPGVDKQKVSVEVKENILTISGEREAYGPEQDDRYYRRERSCGTFQRSFSLRTMITPDKIRASFKNGVLKIEIPRPEEEKPRQVSVSID